MILDFSFNLSELLSGFVDMIFGFVFKLTDIVLAPLNLLITSIFPSTSISSVVDWVGYFFEEVSNVSKFVISYTGFYQEVIDIIIVLVVAIFTLPVTVHGLKTAIRWFRTFRG